MSEVPLYSDGAFELCKLGVWDTSSSCKGTSLTRKSNHKKITRKSTHLGPYRKPVPRVVVGF